MVNCNIFIQSNRLIDAIVKKNCNATTTFRLYVDSFGEHPQLSDHLQPFIQITCYHVMIRN